MTTIILRSLQELEQTIDLAVSEVVQHQQTIWKRFKDIGLALAEIRERALWTRTEHKTWEAYLQARFAFGTDRAAQIMRAAEAGEEFSIQLAELNRAALDEADKEDALGQVAKAKLPMPTNERQIRQLLAAPADLRVKVWAATVKVAAEEGKRPSAEIVRQVTVAIMARREVDPHKVEQERLERVIRSAWTRLDKNRRKRLYGILGAEA